MQADRSAPNKLILPAQFFAAAKVIFGSLRDTKTIFHEKIASTTAKHAFIPATLTVIVLVASSCQKQELKQPVTAQAATETTADELSIQNNLVAWYPFNGNTKDSSGNANDVIFSNATPAAGADGTENTAYAFNGVDNYMRVKITAL